MNIETSYSAIYDHLPILLVLMLFAVLLSYVQSRVTESEQQRAGNIAYYSNVVPLFMAIDLTPLAFNLFLLPDVLIFNSQLEFSISLILIICATFSIFIHFSLIPASCNNSPIFFVLESMSLFVAITTGFVGTLVVSIIYMGCIVFYINRNFDYPFKHIIIAAVAAGSAIIGLSCCRGDVFLECYVVLAQFCAYKVTGIASMLNSSKNECSFF